MRGRSGGACAARGGAACGPSRSGHMCPLPPHLLDLHRPAVVDPARVRVIEGDPHLATTRERDVGDEEALRVGATDGGARPAAVRIGPVLDDSLLYAAVVERPQLAPDGHSAPMPGR